MRTSMYKQKTTLDTTVSLRIRLLPESHDYTIIIRALKCWSS